MSQHIVIYGDPIDGFGYAGPFDSEEAATDFAIGKSDGTGVLIHQCWWTVELESPNPGG